MGNHVLIFGHSIHNHLDDHKLTCVTIYSKCLIVQLDADSINDILALHETHFTVNGIMSICFP